MSLRLRILDIDSIDQSKPHLGVHVIKPGKGLVVLPVILEEVHNFDPTIVTEVPIVWSTEALKNG